MKITKVLKSSDAFRINFEKNIPAIKEYLNSSDTILLIEEKTFKRFFDLDCTTEILYDKLRYILENTDMRVKVQNNKFVDGKQTNVFGFYYENKADELRKKIIDDNTKISNSERERKINVKNMVEEDIIKVRKSGEASINDISTNIPLPYTSICLKCRKKVIIAYPEINCPNCNNIILKSWEDE